MKGVFLTHHCGFLELMRLNAFGLKSYGIELDVILNPVAFSLGIEFVSMINSLLPANAFLVYYYAPVSKTFIENVRITIKNHWDELFKKYFRKFEAVCDFRSLDFVIVGLQALNYPLIRAIAPDLPIIYYPRMHTLYCENLYLDEDDDKFFYVIHDEEMEKYYFPCKNKMFIMSSMNPEYYGNWNGSECDVVTVFHDLDVFSQKYGDPYPSIVNGFPHKLFGYVFNKNWHESVVLPPEQVRLEIRNHRCALAFSRAPTAIATAQLLATGVPTIGFVEGDNEMHRIIKHGESGFVTMNIEECREIIGKLLSDYSYAKKIGDAGREAYYARHNWNTWVDKWTELIAVAVSG